MLRFGVFAAGNSKNAEAGITQRLLLSNRRPSISAQNAPSVTDLDAGLSVGAAGARALTITLQRRPTQPVAGRTRSWDWTLRQRSLYVLSMVNNLNALSPATPEDVQDALAFALQHDGKRQFRTSGEMMAKITARHLLDHLERCGFVLMKKPAAKMFSNPMHNIPIGRPVEIIGSSGRRHNITIPKSSSSFANWLQMRISQINVATEGGRLK